MRTLVKNGTIVTAESEYKADILIVDEKVTSIGTNLEGPFDRILDAEGKYVLPGGVDNHAHFEALNTDGITTLCDYLGRPAGRNDYHCGLLHQ